MELRENLQVLIVALFGFININIKYESVVISTFTSILFMLIGYSFINIIFNLIDIRKEAKK